MSHDHRHLIRSTTDDLYLVLLRQKVEPFDGDTEDYQHYFGDACRSRKRGRRRAEGKQRQQRPSQDQEARREAELRTLTQPLRKEITVWKRDGKAQRPVSAGGRSSATAACMTQRKARR